MTNKNTKKCSISLVVRETKTTVSYQTNLFSKTKKTNHAKCFQESGENEKLISFGERGK